jgi:hypothetical protein
MFTTNDIARIKNDKMEKKIKIYDYIYSKIEKNIKKSVYENKNQCIYKVPLFLSGFPFYNLQEASQHLVEKLKSNKFIVHVQYANNLGTSVPVLLISWPQNIALEDKGPGSGPGHNRSSFNGHNSPRAHDDFEYEYDTNSTNNDRLIDTLINLKLK